MNYCVGNEQLVVHAKDVCVNCDGKSSPRHKVALTEKRAVLQLALTAGESHLFYET